MTYNIRSIESRSERFLVFCLYVGGLNGLRQVYHGMHNNKTKDYENSGFIIAIIFIVKWLFLPLYIMYAIIVVATTTDIKEP